MPIFQRFDRRVLGWTHLIPLLALGLIAGAHALPAAAEAPPVYELEWPIGPIGGALAVPLGATVDGAGNVYVTQRAPQLMMSFTDAGAFRFAWELPGGGCFPMPFSIDLDASGNSFVADFGCSRLVKFGPNRSLIAIIGGGGTGDGRFIAPGGVAVGPDGSVYIADTFNNRIQKFDSNGAFLLKWGLPGSGEGQFNTPFDVATDATGNVYVLDSYNQRIQVFDGSGAFLRAWGEPGFGSDKLLQPIGLDVDAASNVYVADTGNNQIVKFSSTGERLTTWGVRGTGPGQMIAPNDVAADGSGHIYVVDSGNRRIQKFTAPLVASLRVEPRTINLRSGGKWVVAHIEPPAPYAPADIDVASLTLNGVAVDPAAPVDVTDVDADGVPELSVRFSRAAIAETAVSGASDLTLQLAGTVAGRIMTGQDVVGVVGGGDILTYDPGLGAAGVAPGGGRSEAFELRAVTPNPTKAGAGLIVSFSAPDREPAFVEVIDLSGRRVGKVDLRTGGTGLQSAKISLPRSLAPGIYLVRIAQGRNQTTAKFAVIE